MSEIWEYMLAAMKAMCVISVMALGLEPKNTDNAVVSGIIRLLLGVALFTAAYALCRNAAGLSFVVSCDIVFTAGILIYGIFCFGGGLRRRAVFSTTSAVLVSACMHGSKAVFFMYGGHAELLGGADEWLLDSALLAADISVQLAVMGIFVILWNLFCRNQKAVNYIWIYPFFPISQFVVIFFLNGETAYRKMFGSRMSMPGLAVGYAADIVLFYLLINHRQKKELRNRIEEVNRLREIEKAHSDAVASGQAEMDKLGRKFDAQLTAIIDKVESGRKNEASALLLRMKTEVAATKEYRYCANAVVNAVLAEKEKEAKERFVDMDIDLTADAELSVSAMHLCSIFSNLLDNAINASSVYGGERFIHVNSGYVGDYFFVNVENSCDRPLKKAARKGHGYGQRILEDIAKQYDGQFVHGWHDAVYTSRIMLTVRGGEA